jgi:two-component system chemotaxis sensor kinase CheA
LAFDIAKYRALFLEEGAEHLSEISTALLLLEKDAGCVDAIDVIFRMAHSIKSMAASLGYDSIAEVSHLLEDRMQTIRSAARVANTGELRLLFGGLEALEEMIDVVRSTGEAPPLPPELVDALTQDTNTTSPTAASEGGQAKKTGS